MNIDFTETQKQQQIIDLIIKASSYADSSTHQSTLQALNEIEKNTISFISLLLDAILNYKNTIDSFKETRGTANPPEFANRSPLLCVVKANIKCFTPPQAVTIQPLRF